MSDGTYLAILTGAVAAVSLLPLSRNKQWWVRGWEFPRLQLAILIAMLIAAQFVWLDLSVPWSWLLIAVAAACLARQISKILPYTPFWKTEVRGAPDPLPDPDRRLSIMTANVEMTNRNAPALLDLIAENDPDIVLTVESDAWWEEALQPVAKARRHRLSCALDNTYGMHLYSRYPLPEKKIDFLVEEDVPSMQVTVTLPCGEDVRLFCVHPSPPSPTENDVSRERDVELALVGKLCCEVDGPVMVAGDLNDVAWSRSTHRFRRISDLLDPRIGRGMFNSFHARWPLIRWPLDHFFHSSHFSLVTMKRLPKWGSDHFPILVELVLNDKV